MRACFLVSLGCSHLPLRRPPPMVYVISPPVLVYLFCPALWKRRSRLHVLWLTRLLAISAVPPLRSLLFRIVRSGRRAVKVHQYPRSSFDGHGHARRGQIKEGTEELHALRGAFGGMAPGTCSGWQTMPKACTLDGGKGITPPPPLRPRRNSLPRSIALLLVCSH